MRVIIAIALAFLLNSSFGAVLVKRVKKGSKVQIESVIQLERKVEKVSILKSIRESIAERTKTENVIYEEVIYPDDKLPRNLRTRLINKKKQKNDWENSEVRELIKSGKDSNRITLTILGDGYTLSEKKRFFQDANRIVNDMFKGKTFKSYLTLFNIYAVFTPSRESGITDLKFKETAFDLYRSPKGSKRGIIPGNKTAIEKALNLVPHHTDYPIIIANDDYYGGLGGRYAITTRSLSSGSMVLRHELGHNFSNVGEEYDGGQVYTGANFSATKNVSWKHWLDGDLEVHDSKFLTGDYIWQDLRSKDYQVKFNFPESSNYTYALRLSSVGWSSKDDVKLSLDGKELELEGVFTKDRSFFKTKNVNLKQGQHVLNIIDNNGDGDNVLAYANGYAYPASYNFTPKKVAAFNVFDSSQKRRGYRPTHNQCLMRDMRSEVFCPIDQENIWLEFLGRISLIDTVKENSGLYEIKTLKLKGLSYKWFRKKGWFGKREEITELAGLKKADLKKYGKGRYEAEVSFSTPEIRKESDVTTDTFEIRIR